MRYVIVTPARNEEAYLEKTLASVVAQSVKPLRYVVVSDGSTDRTDEIVQQFADQYDFIRLLRRNPDSGRNFGSKVYAFQAGHKQMADLEYDFIGNLDADIELPSNYYEHIMQKLLADPQLGLAGGVRYDLCDGEFTFVECARNSVGGPFQLFRRECYEQIGGYTPLPMGGIDAVAEIQARMHGWNVRSFTDVHAHHYRCTGTAKGSVFNAAYRSGRMQYSIGYHPLFVFFRSVGQVRGVKSAGLASCYFYGYMSELVKRQRRQVGDDVVRYLQGEQMSRLKSMLLMRRDPAMQEG